MVAQLIKKSEHDGPIDEPSQHGWEKRVFDPNENMFICFFIVFFLFVARVRLKA